ncbi:hypothetical protein I4U23_016719 [Adineta vaga]|nr:hypothetical protein I4U23_016719 [Adineta vaga]
MHLEIKHNIQQAYETLSSLPFTCWRAVIDKNMAKKFTLLRAEKMISLYFCVSTVIYAPVYDDQLRWAIDDPVRVWGGVAADEEKILRFCSGDPLTHVQNSMSKFLALDKSDLLRVMNRILRTKLPFSIVIPESDDPLSDKTIRFDGSKLQPRQARFIAALKPQFVQSLQMSNLAELFSKLLTIENDWIDAVNVRLFLGIMYHAKCNNRPIEHIQNRLIKWLCPSYSVIPDGMNSLYAIRAFTEETFLYRDVNLALANIHEESIYYLRDYIHLCISAFAQMLIPFYAGTVYRGVQMTADEIEEYRVGANIRFLGFMSTTKSFEFVSFLGTNVIFIIHTLSDKHQRRLGRYTNADLHISNVTVMPSEEEVLYAPFSSFQIIQIEKSEDDRVTFISLMENDTSAADHVHLQIMQSQVDKGIAKDAYFSPSIISLVSDNDGNMMKQELSKAKDLPVHMRMSIPYKM